MEIHQHPTLTSLPSSKYLTNELSHSPSNYFISLHSTELVKSSQSYLETSGLLPIISSWRQAPWYPRSEIFFQLNPCDNSVYVTSSLTRRWFCLIRICLAFLQVYELVKVKVEVTFTLRLTVSERVSLGVEPRLGLMTKYLLLFDSYGLVFVGRPLWR
jgi:hypothetical protein